MASAFNPTDDITRTREENCATGPRFCSPPPTVPETPLKPFLGRSVRSRIGIAAGLLLNSRRVLPYAERGFDLLTYKTVRSAARPCYPLAVERFDSTSFLAAAM